MTDRACIVAAARGWLGTRFHHQGRLKKTDAHRGGVDCLGLLIGIADELKLQQPDGQLLGELDERDYPHYPDVKRLQAHLMRVLIPIATDEMVPGDILLLHIDSNPQHLAIVSNREKGLGIIHAYAPARAVVEHELDGWWRERIAAAFRYL